MNTKLTITCGDLTHKHARCLFKRLRATAGQGPNYVGPSCGHMLAYVGLSCRQRGPILWLCWPMFASCWPMLSQKIRKMGRAKKRCKTHDILMVGGLSWGYVGPSWGYVGLSWGQCGPILGLCWPILGPCWPILRPMLAHLEAYVGRCWPIRNHKSRKMAKKWEEHKTP